MLEIQLCDIAMGNQAKTYFARDRVRLYLEQGHKVFSIKDIEKIRDENPASITAILKNLDPRLETLHIIFYTHEILLESVRMLTLPSHVKEIILQIPTTLQPDLSYISKLKELVSSIQKERKVTLVGSGNPSVLTFNISSQALMSLQTNWVSILEDLMKLPLFMTTLNITLPTNPVRIDPKLFQRLLLLQTPFASITFNNIPLIFNSMNQQFLPGLKGHFLNYTLQRLALNRNEIISYLDLRRKLPLDCVDEIFSYRFRINKNNEQNFHLYLKTVRERFEKSLPCHTHTINKPTVKKRTYILSIEQGHKITVAKSTEVSRPIQHDFNAQCQAIAHQSIGTAMDDVKQQNTSTSTNEECSTQTLVSQVEKYSQTSTPYITPLLDRSYWSPEYRSLALSIMKMYGYGVMLSSSKQEGQKGAKIQNVAIELLQALAFHQKTPQKAFKSNFENRLFKMNQELKIYDKEWKEIFLNVLLLVSGLGLLKWAATGSFFSQGPEIRNIHKDIVSNARTSLVP